MRFSEGENGRMTREDLEQVQLERLQSMLNRAYKNVPFYRKEFDSLGIDPGALGSVEDIIKLPFISTIFFMLSHWLPSCISRN